MVGTRGSEGFPAADGGSSSSSNSGRSSAFECEEDGAKEDPGLKFLQKVTLSKQEEEEYAKLAKDWIPELVAFEMGSKDDGWKLVSTMFGVHVWSKSKPAGEGPLVVCRGQIQLPLEATFEFLQKQFIHVYNDDKALAQQMRNSDPMSRETKIMYQVPCPEDEFIRIVWGSFKAAGVAWARDFCFLQHACTTTDSVTGERLFCVVAGSIDRPEVPDMEKLCKRIRSTVKTSGFVFREAPDKSIRMSYVVNVNPNGWIPNKIVNIICINQAMNVSRVQAKFVETTKAIEALKTKAPMKSYDIDRRGTHEIAIPRPAAGATPSTVTVKFVASSKIWFRLRGVSDGAAMEWTPVDVSSKLRQGEWVPYAAQTPVLVGFALQPETVRATKDINGGAAPAGGIEASSVELQEKEACVLEWKSGGWFKGLCIFHDIEIA